MNTIQKFAVVLVIAASLFFLSASPASAQVQYWPWLPAVPSVNEPYMYYHPIYQPVRATYYYTPRYWQPYAYTYPYAYQYVYPQQTYYYAPMRRNMRVYLR